MTAAQLLNTSVVVFLISFVVWLVSLTIVSISDPFSKPSNIAIVFGGIFGLLMGCSFWTGIIALILNFTQ